MAAKAQTLIQATAVTTTPNTVLTAGARTTIDAFVVNNTTGTAVTFTANIVPSGGTVGTANQVVSAFSVGPNASAAPIGLNGQTLQPGDFISVVGSAAGLNVRASGRVLTDA